MSKQTYKKRTVPDHESQLDSGPTAHAGNAPLSPIATVHRAIAEYRRWHTARVLDLCQHIDMEGVREYEYPEYEEKCRSYADQADEMLDQLISRLTAAFGLPAGESVTVLGTNFQVIPGEINEQARAAFSSGQCHALAQALTEITGWPAAAVLSQQCADEYDECGDGQQTADGVCICRIEHIVNVRPDGSLIDINGAHPADHVQGREPGLPIVPMTERLWRIVSANAEWRDPDIAVARSFVQPLLASLDSDDIHEAKGA
ncbi:hypothetical protein AB0B15_02935 [Streptomyces sp. NPDC045456]|uniref:hypothetical protein n=1 Tax=Streptomyces sp. NPDC045456 TaxID=3155254 RepID=UPI00340645F6